MKDHAFDEWYKEREPYLANQVEFGFCDSARDQHAFMMLRDALLEAYCAGMRHALSVVKKEQDD
jgi:hypothetical protein